MKIALVCGGNLWFLPFIKNYTTILDDENIEYDLISWNRDGTDEKTGIQFERNSDLKKNKISKLIDFYHFRKFLLQTIKKSKYDKLIIFSPQVAIFIGGFLRKKYAGNYILDYRDLSIDQNLLFGFIYKKVIEKSRYVSISSLGLKKVLPKNGKYVMSHNFLPELARKIISSKSERYKIKPIKLLTIGGIRDYESNSEIIDCLSNVDDFSIEFVGKGIAEIPLKEYALKKGVNNIKFSGYYKKEDEGNYILDSTFLNIYYPPILSHETALSNRFYNSLMYKRPMIVTAKSTQGNYVEKYNLGLSISDVNDLPVKIQKWLSDNDYDDYCQRADELMRTFLEEQDIFKSKLIDFVINN